MENLYDEISQNIVPVRPDRHYRRTKGKLAGKTAAGRSRGTPEHIEIVTIKDKSSTEGIVSKKQPDTIQAKTSNKLESCIRVLAVVQ